MDVNEGIFAPGNDYIKEYFFSGYTYSEITLMLFCRHGIDLSLRQLHRILRKLGLRRHSRARRDVIRHAIQNELRGSGSSLGYRSMAKRLLLSHGLLVSRSNVADFLRELDPEGVAMRRRHQLSRRTYTNKGPNFLIHLDGYDKLKRYGFPIHGAICGFSRRVLWLNVANTNNNPKVVASHFMEFIDEMKGVPRCIRMDNGTENVLIEDIQTAFRWDHSDGMAGRKSVIKGSSHSNQRIERWWRSNKQGGCQFWIDLFKDLEDSGNLSTSNEMQIECLRFCFFVVLQNELDRVKREWNLHSIRKNRNSESPSGKPEIMYYLPNLYEAVDYKTDVRQEYIDAVKLYCHVPFSRSCKEEYSIFFTRRMNEFGRLPPRTADEALELFMLLKSQ